MPAGQNKHREETKASHEEIMVEIKFSHNPDICLARRNKGLPRSV
jgi:hypothetical protein